MNHLGRELEIEQGCSKHNPNPPKGSHGVRIVLVFHPCQRWFKTRVWVLGSGVWGIEEVNIGL